ncbi:ABC transporter ATP-binding protein [soil metagenome]
MIPAVEITRLSHAYGTTTALADVSLDVAPGAFVSIVGPSGCGKSTLLKVLAGLLAPTAGTATISATSTVGRPGLAGYRPQRDLLLPWKRALDNAALGAEFGGDRTNTRRAEVRHRAAELFERFGLAGFEHSWPSELSGGMRQRLALLRTYLTGARVLLLDEPFGALDAITRRDLHAWLQELWVDEVGETHDEPRSALFITHDVDEALFMSDTVHVMSARPGRIVDTIDMTAQRPRQPDIITSERFVASKARLLNALDRSRLPE